MIVRFEWRIITLLNDAKVETYKLEVIKFIWLNFVSCVKFDITEHVVIGIARNSR